MKNMLFIMNPKAGRTTLKNSLVDVLEVFCNNDYAVRTYLTKSADDAERIVQEEGANYDVIVCAGGGWNPGQHSYRIYEERDKGSTWIYSVWLHQ